MNDDQLNRRFKQINDRIDQLIPKPIAQSAKRWRLTPDRWLILATLLVAVLAWWQPQWAGSSQRAADEHIDTRIESTVGKDVQTTKESMSGLRADVNSLKDDVHLLLQKQLNASAQLPKELFQKNIDSIATQLSVAQKLKVLPDPPTIKQFQIKIPGAPPNLVATWIAASAVLNYSSPPPPAYPSLPECYPVGGMKGLTIRGVQNCVLTLDGKTITDVRFENIVVKYSGGPLRLERVQFVNCYFDFTIDRIPPPEGQRIVRQWLATSGKSLTVG